MALSEHQQAKPRKKPVPPKHKKFIMRTKPAPQPYNADDPEFKFAVEYLRTGDLLESARRYIPFKNEPSIGNFLMTHKMQETMKFIMQLKNDGFVISANQLDNMVAAMISFDPSNAFEEDGITVKNIHEMDMRTRAAIEIIETTRTLNGETTKIKFYNRQKALELGMRRRNMFANDNKSQAVQVNLTLEGSS